LQVRDVGGPGHPALEISIGGRTDRIELNAGGGTVRLGQSEVIRLDRNL
jgi:hypothetical protein